METAEDVVCKLFRECVSAEPDGTPGGVSVIVAVARAKEIVESDRNAVRLASKLEGKRELLDELEVLAFEHRSVYVASRKLRAKYAAPEPQPATEEKR